MKKPTVVEVTLEHLVCWIECDINGQDRVAIRKQKATYPSRKVAFFGALHNNKYTLIRPLIEAPALPSTSLLTSFLIKEVM